MTIASILVASYPTVLAIMQAGNEFIDPELRKATAERRLTVQTLGPCVVDGATGAHYTVSEVIIPLVWELSDDERPERDKVYLVKSLIENGVQCHDDVLLKKLGAGRAVASKEYRYNLRSNGPFSVKLYTAIAFLS